MSEHDDRDDFPRPEEERRNRFQRLSEQLTGLLDPESAFRRGQGIVTGVSRATKEELMRLVGVEVRSFLDKMDIADLAQQVVAGLQVDIHMKVKFSRSDGRMTSEITRAETTLPGGDEPAGEGRPEGGSGRGGSRARSEPAAKPAPAKKGAPEAANAGTAGAPPPGDRDPDED